MLKVGLMRLGVAAPVVIAALIMAAPAYANWDTIQVTYAPVQGAAAVLGANGCGYPAAIIQTPYVKNQSCAGGGSNQLWNVAEVPDHGISDIVANYDGENVCMNVDYSDYTAGTQIIGYPCPNGPAHNELFEFNYNVLTTNSVEIVPEYEPAGANLCISIQNGFGTGHDVVLEPCGVDDLEEDFQGIPMS